MAEKPRAGAVGPVPLPDDAGFATLAVRAGQQRSAEQEHAEALYPTSSFVFASAAEAAARFSGDLPGNVYSRFTNPTVRNFEQRLAALEGGERAVATASGMAAISSLLMGLLKAGDHIICSRSVFGTTVVLLEKYFCRFGVEVTFVDLADPDQWRAAIRSNTQLLFLETPSNPLCELADIPLLAGLAHDNDALLVVDNCFCTPALQKPLALGADIVVHSATKYLDGQGRCMGGAVVGREAEMEEVYGVLRSAGPTMSPFNAWVFLNGLETLAIRMRAHCDHAMRVAHWLAEQAGVESVFYAGLQDHPQHGLARQQQSGFGGIISFRVRGGQVQAWRMIDNTRIFSLTANLGDTKSTITHPATTTHSRLSPEDRRQAGISDNLVRISIGLEDPADMIADLQQGLSAV